MPVSADCLNSQSINGRNATPLPIIHSAKTVLGSIELDPASDPEINRLVEAQRIYTIQDDGFRQPWEAHTLWLNPPGKTISQGRTISAVEWIRKLHEQHAIGNVQNAIALLYRAGSIGGLGPILNRPCCFTAAGASSRVVNGSGRISFELIDGDGDRHPQSSNTQSSVFILFSDNRRVIRQFYQEFHKYGIVKC